MKTMPRFPKLDLTRFYSNKIQSNYWTRTVACSKLLIYLKDKSTFLG